MNYQLDGSADCKTAQADARTLMRWWHERGFVQVRAWPEPRETLYRDHHKTWGVASNLVNGLPAGVEPRDMLRAISERRAKENIHMDSLRALAGISRGVAG